MEYRELISKLIARENLSQQEMAAAIDEIFSGQMSDAQMGAFLAALSTKGITFEELAGAAEVMRAKATPINVTARPLVDVVGTGGDGLDTFNISTISSMVTAGAGVVVAKHGNRSASSKCGSADVLENLGLDLDASAEVVERCINEVGIGFMFARSFHGAMKYAAGVRRELGVRTIFNILGPLTNPAGATCQVLGVFDGEQTELIANALRLTGSTRAMVVHGLDGMDEITTCDKTKVSELVGGEVKSYELDSREYFGSFARPEDITGGDAEFNAQIARDILAGKKGPRRDIVLINSAAALVVAGKAEDIAGGIELAAESIDSGAAAGKLEAMVNFIKEVK